MADLAVQYVFLNISPVRIPKHLCQTDINKQILSQLPPLGDRLTEIKNVQALASRKSTAVRKIKICIYKLYEDYIFKNPDKKVEWFRSSLFLLLILPQDMISPSTGAPAKSYDAEIIEAKVALLSQNMYSCNKKINSQRGGLFMCF